MEDIQHPAEYERWFVSTEGRFAHYWSHEWGTTMTLCGRRIHRDGYVADSKDPICSRCKAKMQLIDGTDSPAYDGT